MAVTLFRYGSYVASPGEANVTTASVINRNEAGQPFSETRRWIAELYLTATSQGTLLRKIATIQAAFGRDNQAVTLLGDTISPGDTIGGIRVIVPPSFPNGQGVEGVTIRTIRVEIEAEIPAAGAALVLVSFSETIRWISRGGPLVEFNETLNGRPVPYLARRYTTAHVIQAGQAVGYLDWPPVPRPKWPGALVRDRVEDITSPMRWGRNNDKNFARSWEYEFKSATPLANSPPTRWRQVAP